MIFRLVKLFFLFLVLTFVVALGMYLSFTILVKAEDTVVVPELTGRNVVYCLELLTDLGLNIKVRDSQYSNRIPKHHVLHQHPDPGVEMKKGRDVQIIISKGRQRIFMPDLRQLSLEQAALIVEGNDLQTTVISHAYSDKYLKNRVMAQFPGAGERIDKGSAVNLLVSRGQRARACIMPRLEGLSLASALFKLESFGLHPGTISSRKSAEKPDNTILTQDPRAGDRVTEADLVNLVVNRPPGRKPSLLLRGDGGVRLFRYRLEKGFLNRHIKMTMNCSGMTIDFYDQYVKPDTALWMLIPAYRDATLLLYVDHHLVDTILFNGWEGR